MNRNSSIYFFAANLLKNHGKKMARVTFLAALLAGVLFTPKYPLFRAGIRVPWSLGYASNIARKIVYREPTSMPDWQFDDPGLLLFAVPFYLAQPSYLFSNPNKEIPRSFIWVMCAIYAVMMALLYWLCAQFLGELVTLLLCSFLALSPVYRAAAMSVDVHLFPVYAGILFLLCAFLLGRRPTTRKSTLALCAAGIFACDLFRSSGIFVTAGFLLLQARPESLQALFPIRSGALVKNGALLCLGLLLAASLCSRGIGRAGHPVWHALHAGLMEFGGHIDERQQIYPFFVPKEEIPATAAWNPTWNDTFEINFAKQKAPSAAAYSPEYSAVLREDFFRIVFSYPTGFAKLISYRLWNFFDLNYWGRKEGTDYHSLPESFLSLRGFSSLLVFLLAGYGAVLAPIVAVTLLPLALPPLLVSTTYFYYLLPGQFALLLLAACAVARIRRRFI
ncbi:MAG: hypothetical protein AB7K68_02915 [Bacteriovoracia bacterium]